MITRRALLNAVTGAGAVSEAFEPSAATALAVYAQSGDGVSAGAVQLEEAPSKGSTAWAPVGAAVPVVTGAAAATTYAGRVIADGATNYWRFDEASGQMLDSVGGAHGTVSGSTRGVPGAVEGGKAIRFAVANDYVRVPAGTYLPVGTGPFTLEAWINTTQVAATAPFIVECSGGANGAGFAVLVPGAGLVSVKVANGTTNASASGFLPQGSWHHLAGVLRRGAPDVLEIFIDGVSGGTVNPSANGWNLTSSLALLFGTYSGGEASPDFRYAGLLDEVALYNVALTPAQILAHYQAGARGQFAGLAGARVTVPKAVYGALRLRVTTPIAGGPVTAWVVAGDIPAEEAA